MKRLIAAFILAALALVQPAAAQGRTFTQPELDALLAPVALYPDALLSDILVAATYPDDIREAAEWSRANPHLSGQSAVRAVEPMPWHPSLKALVAFPDLLARMDESPRWVEDLGEAYVSQEPHVMDTVQALRRRAQAAGTPADPHYSVQQHGQALAVVPVQPHVAYVPYYNPYVVYGSWWWPSYRPVYWRPWHPRPAVYVSTGFFRSSVDWHRRHVVHHHHRHHHHAVQRPVHAHHNHHRPQVHHHRVQHPRPIVGPAPTLQYTPQSISQHREHRPLLRQEGARHQGVGQRIREYAGQKSGQQQHGHHGRRGEQRSHQRRG